MDVEKDLPEMEAQWKALEAKSPGCEAPTSPQTGVWNQHTGAGRSRSQAHSFQSNS